MKFEVRPRDTDSIVKRKEKNMTSAPKPQFPEPSAEHRLLQAFIGKWHAGGTSYADGRKAEDPLASGVPWTSEESYEWLPSRFFVLHRWDAMAGERVFKGLEITGAAPSPSPSRERGLGCGQVSYSAGDLFGSRLEPKSSWVSCRNATTFESSCRNVSLPGRYSSRTS